CSINGHSNSLVELQAKNLDNFEAAKEALLSYLQDKAATIFIHSFEVPLQHHRFIVGKGGQNISKTKALPQWDGRLVDIIAQPSGSSSEEVLLVLTRQPGLAPGAESDREALALANSLQKLLLEQVSIQADMTTLTLQIDPKFHGKLIGAGGTGLKELKNLCGNSTNIRFPPTGSLLSEVVLKGPKADVPIIAAKLEEMLAELKRIEKLTNFSANVSIPSELLAKYVGIRDRYAHGAFKTKDSFELGLLAGTDSLHVNITAEPAGDKCRLNIVGPKSFVAQAKIIMENRLETLLNTLDIKINLFQEISQKAQDLLNELDIEAPKRIVKYLIGKDGQ
ncbi:hypothetical protein HDU91_004147, partial [Kappamyces sp. JEL0680]